MDHGGRGYGEKWHCLKGNAFSQKAYEPFEIIFDLLKRNTISHWKQCSRLNGPAKYDYQFKKCSALNGDNYTWITIKKEKKGKNLKKSVQPYLYSLMELLPAVDFLSTLISIVIFLFFKNLLLVDIVKTRKVLHLTLYPKHEFGLVFKWHAYD